MTSTPPWSAAAGGRPTFGYKLHAVVDRATHLPLLVLVTPATVHELVPAPLLLVAAVALFRLPVWAVYADAASDSTACRLLIHRLGACPVIDYCLRRRGKRFLATRFFASQWHRMRAPRTAVERCFAFLKRYSSLTDFRVRGLPAVWQHGLLVHAVILAIALVAHRAGRTSSPPAPRSSPMSPCAFRKAHTMTKPPPVAADTGGTGDDFRGQTRCRAGANGVLCGARRCRYHGRLEEDWVRMPGNGVPGAGCRVLSPGAGLEGGHV